MTTSDQNALDHNVAALSFIASEDAETMDEVFRGTEEEMERTYATVLNTYCKLSMLSL